MENKQTAVEWLEDKINNYDYSQGMAQMRKYILQAKELEKERIMNAFDSGYFNYQVLFHDNAEEYFNETYKTKTIVTEFRDGSVKVETFKSE